MTYETMMTPLPHPFSDRTPMPVVALGNNEVIIEAGVLSLPHSGSPTGVVRFHAVADELIGAGLDVDAALAVMGSAPRPKVDLVFSNRSGLVGFIEVLTEMLAALDAATSSGQ